VQYASDLHLEFEHFTLDRLEMPIDPRADLLVLAGDLHTEVAGMDDLVRRLATQVPVVMVCELHRHPFTTSVADVEA
jgi:hypothetical protein